jgi:signal transduction histidine kinase
MSTPAQAAEPPVEILIAEDSRTQALRLQRILEQHGYHVTHAANGRLALEAAQLKKPTLVISDVVMPEMDGYELCRRVKTDAGLGNIPVILVTTLPDPGDVIRGLECRADNFILKPYDERYLLNRIQNVLLNREMGEAEPAAIGVEIFFNGQRHFITADRLQILNLLLSTYDAAIHRNKELTRAKEELHQLNAKMEDANKELESFSYSVSHDLRAPLRHIAGFANLLRQRGSEQLTENNREYLNKIVDATKQMGQLIEDLLGFSRMGRADMQQRDVDLHRMFKEVCSDLAADAKGRNIEWKLNPLPAVQGDAAMLKQVVVNLISNAIKYTRPRERAEIEIGSAGEENGRAIFFVRDNGAGFDMQAAAKLFGVFQRLHRADEFEGTGIGLANVQRIIARHGGRVWAEGIVDQGATFYFTLKLAATP